MTIATKLEDTRSFENKAVINLDSVTKSRDITFANKGLSRQSYVFPVVMYGCESWTIKKVEH